MPAPLDLVPVLPTYDPWNTLRAVADLLNPCQPPMRTGDPCTHGQAWPCPITRAYWLAHHATTPRAGTSDRHGARDTPGPAQPPRMCRACQHRPAVTTWTHPGTGTRFELCPACIPAPAAGKAA